MKVKDAIKQLEELDPEEDLLLAYWLHDCFPELPEEDWPYLSSHAEAHFDWSSTHNNLEYFMLTS